MKEAVIVSTARTGIDHAFKGSLCATRSPTMMGQAIAHAIRRAGVEGAEIEDVATQEIAHRDVTLERDEGNRPETTLEGLRALGPVIEGGVGTAGNASRLCARGDGHRSRPRDPETARAAGPEGGRHRAPGARRSLRLPGAPLPRPPGYRPGAIQRRRRRHLDRPSLRHDRRGVRYVVATMCVGGGMGAAVLFEVA